MDKYYFLDCENILGPFSPDELVERKISLDSLICKSGTNEWKKISDFSELDILRQTLPPTLPIEIRKKRETANLIIDSFQKLFSKKTLLTFTSFLVFGLLIGLINFYIVSDGGKSYSEYKRINKYLIEHPEAVKRYNDFVKNAVGFRTYSIPDESPPVEKLYKERFESSLEKSKSYAFYSFLSIFFVTLLFFVTKSCVNWVKNNSDKNSNKHNKVNDFQPQYENFLKSPKTETTNKQRNEKKETTFHSYLYIALLIIGGIILLFVIINLLSEKKMTEVEKQKISRIADSIGNISTRKVSSPIIQPVAPDSDTTTYEGFYTFVIIGKQKWSAENINVTTFRNGDPILYVTTDVEWKKANDQHLPAYKIDSFNRNLGYLYNWFAVTDSRGLASIGYHIPSLAEWKTLVNYLGGEHIAGRKMITPTGWPKDFIPINSCGFDAYPDRHDELEFINRYSCSFWTSSELDFKSAYSCDILYVFGKTGVKGVVYGTPNKENGFHSRCINDTIFENVKNPFLNK